MTPEMRRRVGQLFDEALSIEAGKRAAFVAEASKDDPPGVRSKVESLLADLERAAVPGLLKVPPADSVGDPDTAPGVLGAPESVPQTLASYEILGELGRGGMGVVYKARQVKLNRLVALKMIGARAHALPGYLDRFRTEAEAVARFQHPNLVQIYEVSEQDGRPFFALEYVEGGNLAQKLAGTPLPARQAATLVETLAHAMHYAHRHGIVHRDLKPGNVLLTADGVPKITDFGLARSVEGDSGLTKTGVAMGTPSYMAPEQAEGKKEVGPAADIYALGAILYEMLTGRPPFVGVDEYDIIDQVKNDEPVPPSRLQPKVPHDLATICLHCLHKEPRKRYESAEALAEDLRRFLAREPIRARPVGYAGRLWRWCRRNPALAAAGSVAVTALVAVAVVSIIYNIRQTKALKENQRLLADVTQDLGLAYCNREEVSRGILLFGRSLEYAAEAGDPKREKSIRANLAHWSRPLPSLRSLVQYDGSILAFSPDGKTILIKDRDGAAALLEGATGKSLGGPAERGGEVVAGAFSPDGKLVATGSKDNTVQLWDAESGRALLPPFHHDDEVLAVAFSPDGQTVLAGSKDGKAQFWEAAAGRPLGPLLNHGGEVLAVAFSPDGESVVTVGADGVVKLWKVSTRKPFLHKYKEKTSPQALASLVHHDKIKAVAFSPDGQTLLTGSWDQTARLWEVASGKPLGPPLPHYDKVEAVAFAAEVGTFWTGTQNGAARLWGHAPPDKSPFRHDGPVLTVAFSPDGKTILTGSEVARERRTTTDTGEVRLWGADTGQLIWSRKQQYPVLGVAFSPDGQTILTGSGAKQKIKGDILLWESATGAPLGKHPPRQQHAISPIAFSPDGEFFLTGGSDGTVQLWNTATRELRHTLDKHKQDKESVGALMFRPDGKFIATGSKTAWLWDGRSGAPIRPLFVPHHREVSALAFGPDGQTIVMGDSGGGVRLLKTAPESPISSPLLERGAIIWAVAFSPDGTMVLTGCGNAHEMHGEARLWDVDTRKPLGPPLPHRDAVFAVAFNPLGKNFLTGSIDWTARIWKIPTPVEGDVQRVVLWTQVITGLELNSEGNVQVLDAQTWRQRGQRLEEWGGPPVP
jgi:WD40 repeat protein/tRNA A-37 threonylcarbamoyl transferase component Bud32